MAEYKIEAEAHTAFAHDKDEALEFLRQLRAAQGVETATVSKREDDSWNTVFVHLPTAYADVLLLTE